MKQRDYFVQALNSSAFRKKQWVISAFSKTREPAEAHLDNPYPFRIIEKEDGYYFINPFREGEHTLIEGVSTETPAFSFQDKLKLKAGEMVNLSEDITTTYGQALFNQLVLVYAFHDKIPYQNGEIKAKAIEALIEPRLTDTPEQGAPEPDSELWVGGSKAPIYVSEYKKFGEAIFSLSGYSQLCVPAATPKSMVAPPGLKEYKEELFKRFEGKLHDPSVIAEIDRLLVEFDKEYLKGDRSEKFYIGGSQLAVKRKKMHLMYGAESAFSDGSEADLIKNSLAEGWDIDKMPGMMNSLREGSYSRGKLTALGGESVKYFMRVFQNTRVEGDDCGTKLGRERSITDDNKHRFIGNYKMNPSGVERLTRENIDKYVGKTITIRSPMYCVAEGTLFCKTCVGDKLAENPKGLGAAASAVGSEFMSIFMSAAHSKELSTAPWTLEELK